MDQITTFTKLKTFLVGQHFVPPSKVVLKALPAGAQVELLDASDNPYDANAIKVKVAVRAFDQESLFALEFELLGMGSSVADLNEAGEIFLGHVAASGGKPLAKAKAADASLVGNVEIRQAMQVFGMDFPLKATAGFVGELVTLTVEFN